MALEKGNLQKEEMIEFTPYFLPIDNGSERHLLERCDSDHDDQCAAALFAGLFDSDYNI